MDDLFERGTWFCAVYSSMNDPRRVGVCAIDVYRTARDREVPQARVFTVQTEVTRNAQKAMGTDRSPELVACDLAKEYVTRLIDNQTLPTGQAHYLQWIRNAFSGQVQQTFGAEQLTEED
jgi:hypothetical protein